MYASRSRSRRLHRSPGTAEARHLESFGAWDTDIPTGKGCINLRERDPMDTDAIVPLIRHAIEHPKSE